MSGSDSILPDEAFFSQFRKHCSSTDGWNIKYDKNKMKVWVEVQKQAQKNAAKIHMIKCRMTVPDVSAATMYDVIHDGPYRSTWDPTMLESYDIARLSGTADIGYYAWACPSPLKNRDVVTLRSWQVTEKDYVIVNFSVKHAKHPPRTGLVRAISIMTGYLIEPTGPNSCSFTYLSQADPKGSLPKWVVNKASQILAPKVFSIDIHLFKSVPYDPVMKSVHKAGQIYPGWKAQNCPEQKPWLFPEQNTLPMMDPLELSIQRADSLENVDESYMVDAGENGDSS